MEYFKKAVDSEKHYFDFASFIFRITAWWTAFALLLSDVLSLKLDVRTDSIPLDINFDIDISTPAMIVTVIGLAVFGVYGLLMVARLWVILAKVRDGLFPPRQTLGILRFLLTLVVFSSVSIAVLLAVVMIVRSLK